jgi:hypothetical protein
MNPFGIVKENMQFGLLESRSMMCAMEGEQHPPAAGKEIREKYGSFSECWVVVYLGYMRSWPSIVPNISSKSTPQAPLFQFGQGGSKKTSQMRSKIYRQVTKDNQPTGYDVY